MEPKEGEIMGFASKMPFCTACGIFFAVSVCAYYCGAAIKFFFVVSLLLVSAVIPFYGKHLPAIKKITRPEITAALILSAAFAMAVSYVYFDVYAARILLHEGRTEAIEATVTDVIYKTDYSGSYVIKLSSAGGRKLKAKAKLYIENECDLDKYDTVSLTVTFDEQEKSRYSSDIKYAISKGQFLSATSAGEDCVITGKDDAGLICAIEKFNRRCAAKAMLLLGEEDGGFVSGILLGNRSDVPDTVNRDFQKLGLSHLISVSGQHLAILCGGLNMLLTKLHIRKSIRSGVMILSAVAVTAVTGFSLSAVRSAIMLILCCIGYFLSAENDALTSLFAAAAIIVLLSPNAVLDVGLLLSFSATLGLLTAGQSFGEHISARIANKGRFRRFIGNVCIMAAVTVSAVMFTLPLTWIYFGDISVVSPLTNLLFIIPATVVLYTGPFMLLFGSTGFIGKIFTSVCGVSIRLIIFGAEKLARLPGLTVSLKYDFTYFAAAAAGAVIIILLFIKRKKSYMYFLPLTAFILVFSVCLGVYSFSVRDETKVLFVTVKKNDSFAVHSGGKTLLCDISDGSYSISQTGAELIKTELYSDTVDVYMLTHYHQRNISTFIRLAENYYISRLLLPGPQTEAEQGIAGMLEAAAEKSGCNVYYYPANEPAKLVFGEAYIIMPERAYIPRSTHPIISLELSTGNGSIAYIGSSALDYMENCFTRDIVNSSDVLIFGIHGPVIKNALNLTRSDLHAELTVSSSVTVAASLGIEADYVLNWENDDKYCEIILQN